MERRELIGVTAVTPKTQALRDFINEPKNYELLLNMARALCRRAQLREGDAEDVLQSALSRAWAHAESFQGRAAISSWLGSIVYREFLNYVRRVASKRAQSLDGLKEFTDFEPADGAHNGDVSLVHDERTYALLEQALSKIPPEQAQVLREQLFEQLSYAEMAERHQSTVGRIRGLLFRARRAVRGLLPSA